MISVNKKEKLKKMKHKQLLESIAVYISFGFVAIIGLSSRNIIESGIVTRLQSSESGIKIVQNPESYNYYN